MAQSTLEQAYSAIRSAIGFFLYGKRSSWTADQTSAIDECFAAGLRRFYFPDPVIINGRQYVHRWHFLRVKRSIDLWPEITAVVNGTPTNVAASVMTLTDTTLYDSMIADATHTKNKRITFDVSGNTYRIKSFTAVGDDVSVTVDGNASGEGANKAVTIEADGDYHLSADFGGVEGDIFYRSPTGAYTPMRETSPGEIRRMRQISSVVAASPPYFAIEQLAPEGASLSARWLLSVWPTPGQLYTCDFAMRVLPDMLTSGVAYPYGGAAHAETIEALCIAAADLRMNDRVGERAAYANARLLASIQEDLDANTPDLLGYNADRSGPIGRTRRSRGLNIVTVNGIAP